MFQKLNKSALAGLLLVIFSVAPVAIAQGASASAEGVVNVNEATLEQLTLLPRVGPTVAGRILEHREANGEFASKEELMLVRGIGERTFEGLESFVTIKGSTTLKAKVKAQKQEEKASEEE